MIGLGAYTQAKAVGNMMNRYGGPMGLAGKLVGLGQEEVEAGVPWWAWLSLGALAGGAVVYQTRRKLEKIVGA